MTFSDRWREGGRLWSRLTAHSAGPVTGDDALAALSDIGALRRVLDQAELALVRTARDRSKSWTEIATSVGITRQSAWERWREIDRVESTRPVPQYETALEVATGEAVADWERDLIAGSGGGRRRSAQETVPDVVGLAWPAARARIQAANLRAVSAAGGPAPAATDEGWVVTDQSPESGARVIKGSVVRLWLRPDGDAGVREPRRPRPDLLEMRAAKPLADPAA
ncbi:PASTA domain-containing protein [Tsukamurella soli]|uniref:PASTA domain-containing protein n=1 Tax=Tsukamurella soli TaxID=644556 RepID=A0ABP8JTE3_9ACTN